MCDNFRKCIRVVDVKEQVYAAAICSLCLATALEALTGQGYINIHNAWTEARKWKLKFAEVQQWRKVE